MRPRLQVESDIAPFKGLLLGLFFISAGMEVSFATFFANVPLIIGSLVALIAGKTALMFAAGLPFGLSKVSALRSGLYIAPGGEFAFVVLAEAVQAGLLPAGDMRAIFFMVVLSMAITPYLAVRRPPPLPPDTHSSHACSQCMFKAQQLVPASATLLQSISGTCVVFMHVLVSTGLTRRWQGVHLYVMPSCVWTDCITQVDDRL